MDIHTTELSEPCQRKVQLTAEGKRVGSMPTALYRGNLIHAATRLCHERGRWDEGAVETALIDAGGIVARQAKDENRPLTEAVTKSCTIIMAECARMLAAYGQLVAPLFVKVIALEAPIRLTLDVDGEPAEFASHIDFIARDKDGRLCIPDWKSGSDAPTRAYLNRNIQLALYWLACHDGLIQVDGWTGWQNLGEWPRMAWVHMNNLLPYGRKTTVVDQDTGEEVTYEKGQKRPLNKIVQWCDYLPECADAVRAELATRVRMRRAGLYPAHPDPVGCFLCECRDFCPSWTYANGGEA